jgi:hypothetical protein
MGPQEEGDEVVPFSGVVARHHLVCEPTNRLPGVDLGFLGGLQGGPGGRQDVPNIFGEQQRLQYRRITRKVKEPKKMSKIDIFFLRIFD